MNGRRRRFLSTPSARRATAGGREAGKRQEDFYPRPLRGGRPGGVVDGVGPGGISIHALCEEGDSSRLVIGFSSLLFLSTPSARRATRKGERPSEYKKVFLSTPSARRATLSPRSVHSTRAFLSTPSARRATGGFTPLHPRRTISIHALCEEGDSQAAYDTEGALEFLSTPSARRATRTRRAETDLT